MENKYSNFSDKDFYYKYIELISKGYTDDSPEMVELFKARSTINSKSSEIQSSIRKKDNQNSQYGYYHTQSTSNQTHYQQTQSQNQRRVRSGATSQKQQTSSRQHSKTDFSGVNSKKYPQNKVTPSNSEHLRRQSNLDKTNTINFSSRDNTRYNNYTRNSTTHTDSIHYRSHIVIDPDSGNYTLLDNHLNIVDSMHSNPLFSLATRRHKLKKFKKQLKKDFKLYKKSCKEHHQKPNPKFKEMFSLTKYYLQLCPDADYQILELLRNNITTINPAYANYQTACAEYLYELAQFRDGDPSKLPFDINFCCDKINNNHIYIAHRFNPASDPVKKFKVLYLKKYNLQSEFQSNIRYEAPRTKFSKARNIHTITTHDREDVLK